MASPSRGLKLPPRLQPGDKVRFVSPASSPDRESVQRCAELLRGWGLTIDYGTHAFRNTGYLAGTDDERLEDLNTAFRDDSVRAIFTTRGGKGSYRIADQLDFEAARHDPKFLVGFSDITVLHLALWKHCQLSAVHGALMETEGRFTPDNEASLRNALMGGEPIVIRPRQMEPTSALTTSGVVNGILVGGNLDSIATAAGWALPSLAGAILLVEAVGMGLGHIDRQLTMLRKAGHLAGVAGVAVGQFTDIPSINGFTVIDLLKEHLTLLDVPVLGGLPLGHGPDPLSTLIGVSATVDATAQILSIETQLES